MNQKPIAYSYLRFSTALQDLGDSKRRQIERAERIAELRGLELSDLSFNDLGVSSYRSKHATEGQLGVFLKMVRDEKIQSGSYLLLEEWDRFGRDFPDKTFKIFLDVIHAGINIIITSSDDLYNTETIRKNPWLQYTVLGQLQQGHEESRKKSERVAAAKKAKRIASAKAAATGAAIKLTGNCPDWLKSTAAGFEPIPERVELIQKIYDMYEGGMGFPKITRHLNTNNIKTWSRSKGWHQSRVSRIIGNRALLGELHTYKVGENGIDRVENETGVIENYYPKIIDKDQFERVELLRSSKRKGRQKIGKSNLFKGLVFCGECGAPMLLEKKGKKKTGHNYINYYRCSNNIRKYNCDNGRKAEQKEFDHLILISLTNEEEHDIISDNKSLTFQNEQKLRNLEIERDKYKNAYEISLEMASRYKTTDKDDPIIENLEKNYSDYLETVKNIDQLKLEINDSQSHMSQKELSEQLGLINQIILDSEKLDDINLINDEREKIYIKLLSIIRKICVKRDIIDIHFNNRVHHVI